MCRLETLTYYLFAYCVTCSTDPSTKYLPYREVPFPPNYTRQWPNKRTTVSPTWLSTDLRDGNQALVNPMSNATKLELFK